MPRTALFREEPEIYEKTDRAVIMADKVAHEHVDYVIIHRNHRCTDYKYSIEWLIARAIRSRYARLQFKEDA